jgi:hypothetical protein
MTDIFYAKVLERLDADRYRVKRLNTGAVDPTEIATLLTPLPNGGMRTLLDDKVTHYCVCMKDQTLVCIIGFIPTNGAATFNDKPVPDNEAAGSEMYFGKNSGIIKGYSDGSIGMFAEEYSQILLEPRPQSIFIKVRALILRLWTGFITYTTKDDVGTFIMFIRKLLRADAPSYKLEIGTLDTNAMSRETITDGDTVITETKAGDTIRELTWPKGKITIDMAGDVIIACDGIVYIGGKTNSQQLVTKSWVMQAFKSHVHPTTGPGAPTLAPMPDLTLDSSVDNANGHFTFTTKAE